MTLRTPCLTCFGTTTPTTYANDLSELAVSTRITFGAAGVIRGVRLFLDNADNDIHEVAIFQVGTVFAKRANCYLGNQSATGSAGTAGKWWNCWLQKPLKVTAGQSFYIAASFPFGKYWHTSNFFNTAHTNGSLTAPADGTGGFSNGAYHTGPGILYPNATFQKNFYGTDVLFGDG
jgi:hypothetical protein